jgi:hypothetical protein
MIWDQRDLDVEPRSVSGRTLDFDRSAQRFDAIFDSD